MPDGVSASEVGSSGFSDAWPLGREGVGRVGRFGWVCGGWQRLLRPARPPAHPPSNPHPTPLGGAPARPHRVHVGPVRHLDD